MAEPIKKGLKILDEMSLEKIRTLSEEILVKLYYHSNDPIQKILIEELCKIKGYQLVIEDPAPKQYA